MGGGRGYGPTHSQSIEKMFLGVPGLKIIAPSHFHKPGLTLQRIASTERTPVLFIEHKLLYGEMLRENTDALPVTMMADETGYDTAVVTNYRSGVPDISVVAYGGVTRQLVKVMADLAGEEIRIQAVLPACIDPPPIATIAATVKAADRVMIIEEAHEGFSWATGIASALYASLWGSLKAPIKIVTSDRQIIPTSFDDEALMLVGPERIEAGLMEVLSWA
jgi:pyruvate/2-oxoglutarate/acetoin dehydrogenase E1 component